jgi:hypothetical protein
MPRFCWRLVQPPGVRSRDASAKVLCVFSICKVVE